MSWCLTLILIKTSSQNRRKTLLVFLQIIQFIQGRDSSKLPTAWQRKSQFTVSRAIKMGLFWRGFFPFYLIKLKGLELLIARFVVLSDLANRLCWCLKQRRNIKWHGVKWYAIKWHAIKWHAIKWHAIKRNATKWHGVK